MMGNNICSVDGCNQPRYVNKSGVMAHRCHPHMKELWRENNARGKPVTSKNGGVAT